MAEQPQPPNAHEMSDDEVIVDIQRRFNRILEQRSEMHLRVAKRVTAIIRVGIFSVGAVALGYAVLLYELMGHFDSTATILATMNKSFGVMTQDMGRVRQSIASMNQSVSVMPAIVQHVETISSSVDTMNQDVGRLYGEVGSLDGHMIGVAINVNRMNHTFGGMNHTVLGIGREVDTMSGPMKVYNGMRSMIPFP